MSGRRFVDTNVLVYAHDSSAGPKHDRAASLIQELWESGGDVLSTQVLQDLCVNLRRRTTRPGSGDEIRRLIRDYLGWKVITNTPATIVEALDAQQRRQLSFWDALIICAAETAGASILYSEDLSPDQTYGSLRVVNPFGTSP
ncbi:MAG TPA: PIN domain-containing protein [Candidatus Acidoferrales bacterium]|nr:PIN domain-containing protein [Candidatus Acidoferrales bacterium]